MFSSSFPLLLLVSPLPSLRELRQWEWLSMISLLCAASLVGWQRRRSSFRYPPPFLCFLGTWIYWFHLFSHSQSTMPFWNSPLWIGAWEGSSLMISASKDTHQFRSKFPFCEKNPQFCFIEQRTGLVSHQPWVYESDWRTDISTWDKQGTFFAFLFRPGFFFPISHVITSFPRPPKKKRPKLKVVNHLSFFQRFLLPLSLVTSPNPTFPAFQVYVPPPEALRTGKVTDGAIVRKDFASSKMLARDNVFKRPSSGGSSSSSSTGSASVFTQPIPSVFRVDQVSTLPFFLLITPLPH